MSPIQLLYRLLVLTISLTTIAFPTGLKSSVKQQKTFRQAKILSTPRSAVDATLVCFYRYGDGLGQIVERFAEMLKGMNINWRTSRSIKPVLKDASPYIASLLRNPSKQAGKVAIFTDAIWLPAHDQYGNVPKESLIKIAYSMLECSAIPQEWVRTLNEGFDAVVVPDPWLVKTYTQSGVTIPIFVLPLAVKLDEFLEKPLKTKQSRVFVFGNTSGSWIHKNQTLLIDAFAHAFGNSPHVKLVINSRGCDPKVCPLVYRAVQKWNLSNIEFNVKSLSREEYVNLLDSFDAYVSFSKGEGYALIPRETLALGRPTILSDNTAHSTLCASGFVKSVPAPLLEPAEYSFFKDENAFFFNCHLKDAVKALRDVYNNYTYYLEKAKGGREWVKQYSHTNAYLRKQYRNLVKPQSIALGDTNKITDKGIITTSATLFRKYKKLISDS